MKENICEALSAFLPGKDILAKDPLPDGLVHQTFLVKTQHEKYILQKINTHVFKNPHAISSNMALVTDHLITQDQYSLRVPLLIKTQEGKVLFGNETSGIWRCTIFIDNHPIVQTVSEELAYSVARAFGTFDDALHNLDPSSLHITIPDFHNPTYRMGKFTRALQATKIERDREVREVLDLLEEQKALATQFQSLALPLQVCHNDAKPSNILFDQSKRPIAIIDLDTVMPGTPILDFADLVRSMSNSVSEDEAVSDALFFDRSIYRALKDGYLSAYRNISVSEKDNLWLAAAYIIFEQALRFMTDYLAGNIYYRIEYPRHNLVRAQNQLALLQSFVSQDLK